MNSEIIPKVFVLTYDISEEDHGIVDFYSSFELARAAKLFVEKESQSSPFFIRFSIDVYEVNTSISEVALKYFCHPGLIHKSI